LETLNGFITGVLKRETAMDQAGKKSAPKARQAKKALAAG